MLEGGQPQSLWHPAEIVIICGAAFGSLVVMAPGSVILKLGKGFISALAGSPYNKRYVIELLCALYKLCMVWRRDGIVALEDHITKPEASDLFVKFPLFLKQKEILAFVCGGLRPLVDGQVKPDQIEQLLELEIEAFEEEGHAPVSVLQKVGDSMPGFGIVAAVLGIILTMGAINGPIETVGYKVAAALVGTFLGILVAYGYINPMSANLEFAVARQITCMRAIRYALVGFAKGASPMLSIEIARRSLPEYLKPDADELEGILKSLN